MAGRHKILSPDHARALIKEAIGKIEGDRTIETEAAAEIASIEAKHASLKFKAKRQRTRRT